TFVSNDGGKTWGDHPYYAPDAIDPKTGGSVRASSLYGEDNAAVIDPRGKVVLGALYAYAPSSATSLGSVQQAPSYRYAVALWREPKAGVVPEYNGNLALLQVPEGAKADSLHLVSVPAKGQVLALWRQEDASN